MASSSTPRTYSYNVFSSFHGPDVRKTLLSHLREHFKVNGINMFDDTKIERSSTIAPSLIEAIRESRISIVILSKKYASSSWCLDELVEILECKQSMGQIVMTIFYGVDPSDVRKQRGKFGIAFDKTCAEKTDEEKQKWSKALEEVGNIAGEDFLTWENEVEMIKKITRDVLNKKNATPSRDFDGMVGIEAHLREMESLLNLDSVIGVEIVAISGPAGIGKTTIARALQCQLSDRFQVSCFVDNDRGSYHCGFDEYGLKLHLQEQFLSKVLNQSGMRIRHLGAIKKNLSDMRVLIILDDVNDPKQLEALANETTWFGPGSRIVVTTENKGLLQQHGIDNIYHVGFPSTKEALKILCTYAFRQTSPWHGFGKLAESVTELCCNLPLGLRVMGSSLRGKKKKDDWEAVVRRLETNLDRDIEDVLKVGYESLDEKEQTLFLHIAVFFHDENYDLVKTMLAETEKDLDVEHMLKILENRSLIEIERSVSSGDPRRIVMHRLLQQVGKKAIHKQEPWKQRILIDADEICNVLEEAKGIRRAVSGISFDISNIDEVSISQNAFRRMPNLQFLRIYKSRHDGNYIMHIPKEMEFPRRLRLLDWKAYPSKSLPPTFQPQNLVELLMRRSPLEKLWEGSQPFPNLRTLDLVRSKNLKELPDLSNATNLEALNMSYCESLIEIPPSVSHLPKLWWVGIDNCTNLQAIPAHMNMASLESVGKSGCSRLRNIPLQSTNIPQLNIRGFSNLPKSLTVLFLSNYDIERIPDCIIALHQLEGLFIDGCRRLTSLPELPCSLAILVAENCESLETVFCPSNTPNPNPNSHIPANSQLIFGNCFKLSKQARREIVRRSFEYHKTLIPGGKVPAEFDHRARRSSLNIVLLDGNKSYSGFVFCLVLSPNHPISDIWDYDGYEIRWSRSIAQDDGYPVEGFVNVGNYSRCEAEHLFIFRCSFEDDNMNIVKCGSEVNREKMFERPEVSREMMFKFNCKYDHVEIIACGAKTWTQEESIKWSNESGSEQASEDKIDFESCEEASEDDNEFESRDEASEDDIEFESCEEVFQFT